MSHIRFCTAVLILTIFAFTASSFAMDLEEINARIKQAGLEWTAGETSMSHLTAEEFSKYLNLDLSIPDDFEKYMDNIDVPKDMPRHLDWSDFGGENYLTAIKDQHPCGTCATFSSLGAFEGHIKILMNNSFIEPDLSEQSVYSCDGPIPYTLFHPAIYTKKHGAADESCYPYQCDAFGDRPPCEDRCEDWSPRSFKITDHKFSMFPSPEKIMAALQDGPIVAGFQVREGFQEYTSGVFENIDGAIMGGHGVVVVGYDADDEYWICKNSWGQSWGENGYFKYRWDPQLLGFGYQIMDITLDEPTLCGANLPPLISQVNLATGSQTLDEGSEIQFMVDYLDTEANLAGGELWYAIDGGQPEKFEAPLTMLTGVSSQNKEAYVFSIPESLETGEHTLTVFLKDLCMAQSNSVEVQFTVGDPEADDDDDNQDDDVAQDDSDSADDDDDDGGCGC